MSDSMSLFVFWGLIYGLFGIYLDQYLVLCREAYSLWAQEIAYTSKTEIDKNKEASFFGSIESLAREICRLADELSLLFTILCFSYILTACLTVYTITSSPSDIKVFNIIPSDKDNLILTVALIISAILFISLPKMLGYLDINILEPSKTNQIDKKIFFVWYKYRIFEKKEKSYKTTLRPKGLYKILAEMYNNDEKNGEYRKIPQEIITALEKEKLIKPEKELHP